MASKQLILLLSALALLALALGILVPALSLAFTANIPQVILFIGAVFFLLGCLMGLAAWAGGMVKTAAIGQWGWFVVIALFNVFGALAYALRGPAARAVD
jgi:hypothetical protein